MAIREAIDHLYQREEEEEARRKDLAASGKDVPMPDAEADPVPYITRQHFEEAMRCVT